MPRTSIMVLVGRHATDGLLGIDHSVILGPDQVVTGVYKVNSRRPLGKNTNDMLMRWLGGPGDKVTGVQD